jgi:phosphopentomutase
MKAGEKPPVPERTRRFFSFIISLPIRRYWYNVSSMRKLFLLFIDGIGLAPLSDNNPVGKLFSDITGGEGLQSRTSPVFYNNSVLVPLDATLGVKGEPQSATGQTSIFTGINASRYLGYHLPAFPNEELVKVIAEKSVMKALSEQGVSVATANMYSRKFFEDRGKFSKNRFPVSTLTIQASGASFPMSEEYEQGKAVFADITGEMLIRMGYSIDIITPEEAGNRIRSIMDDSQFVFFEYFMTDHYGHKRKREELDKCISQLNRFVSSLYRQLKSEEAILIVSDHGNAEDMETGGHTRNPVPGLLTGGTEKIRERFSRCRDLTEIYNFLLDYYKK